MYRYTFCAAASSSPPLMAEKEIGRTAFGAFTPPAGLCSFGLGHWSHDSRHFPGLDSVPCAGAPRARLRRRRVQSAGRRSRRRLPRAGRRAARQGGRLAFINPGLFSHSPCAAQSLQFGSLSRHSPSRSIAGACGPAVAGGGEGGR